MTMTKRDKTNMLLGVLGYTRNYEHNYKIAYQLLKQNNFDFQKIINFSIALGADEVTETSFISLASGYPKIKKKMSEKKDVMRVIYQFDDIEIEIE